MKLGNIKKITDLRSVWKHEAKDFTKWLAEEKNLELLGNEIGLNISLIKTEAETGKKIIIENQLERTDHDHLGKIITYASGYNAETIIWIVKEFRSEHKSAIDWLNEHTDEKINFFGIVIELWQITDSPIAPKFNIISQPNTWSKAIKNSSKKGELSETALKQINFFEGFISFCNSKGTTLNLGNPQPATPSYYSISIGITGIWIAIKMNKNKRIIKLDLYFTDKDLFNLIRQETEEEAKKEFPGIIWNEMPNYKGANVGFMIKNFNLDNQEKWEEYYKWLKDNSEKLVNFFYKRIIKIKNDL